MTLQLNAMCSAVSASVLFAVISTGAVFGQAIQTPGNAAQQAGGQAGGQSAATPYHDYATGYPAPEVQAVPMAYARTINARAEQDQMLTDLHVTVDRIREDFNYSPEMIAATREQNDAYLAYDDARRRVLENLSSDPTYRAMISLVVSLKHKLEDERPPKKPTDAQLEQILATATLKLSYASAASAMEVAALSADADVMQTHARLIVAGDKVGQLRADFDRQIRRNPEFLAARRNLDEARIARLTAEAFLDGALDARSVALDYAYYLQRFDQYSYSPVVSPIAYGYSPYPYGVGYGYGNGDGHQRH